jgi:HAD superfamily hydrolase (TIGR01509 family)
MNTDTDVEVLLLDVGGVIVPPADPDALARVAQRLALSVTEIGALLYEWEPWYALSTGRLEEDAYWRTLGERVGWDAADLRRLAAPVWEPTRVDEEVMDLARALHGRLRLAILSNATTRLEDHLRRLGVAPYFDPIINSARVGLRKPDPRIFASTLDALGVAPGAILFVDDKRRNTAVAEQLGIPSVLFDRAATLVGALASRGLLSSGGRDLTHP